MSNIGNWAYVNTATVRPFLGMDDFTGSSSYGDEYEIKCYISSTNELVKDADGIEFVPKMEFFTEVDTVKVHDLINGEKVRMVQIINASPFGEINDYRIYI